MLYKYFARSLADMIWKDAVSSKGEVGALEALPTRGYSGLARSLWLSGDILRKPALLGLLGEDVGERISVSSCSL